MKGIFLFCLLILPLPLLFAQEVDSIIHNAIQKRAVYENELNHYTCDIAVNGQLMLRSYPEKLLGRSLELSTSAGQLRFYAAMTKATYARDNDRFKTQILSSDVDGSSSAWGFSYPQTFSFYQEVVRIGDNLNARGFVSPIAGNAKDYYHYTLDSTYTENGHLIYGITVTPRRKYDPAFSGQLFLMEDGRIHHVKFQLLKQQQMQILDTLIVEQSYQPFNGKWAISQTRLLPSTELLGFNAYGSFIQLHTNYNFNPKIREGYFNNVVMIFDTTINRQSLPYWDTTRSLLLRNNALVQYHTADTLEEKRARSGYLDSIDRARNKPNWFKLTFMGQTFSRAAHKRYISVPPAIDLLNYNTVEGLVANFAPEMRKYWNSGRYISVLANLRYGFSNQHFNAHVTGVYRFYRSLNSLRLSVGQRVFQFNNDQPITPRVNTINTVLYRSNFMKLYEAKFLELGYDYDPAADFVLRSSISYQNRSPLENTAFGSWGHPKGKEFTPNYPVEITDANIVKHSALSASLTLRWQPGSRYIQLPDRKANIGSEYPVFDLSYTQGLHGIAGSDVDYSKWSLSMMHQVDLKMKGKLQYKLHTGGFLNKNKVFIPDYQHFAGNDGLFNSNYLGTLLMSSFYKYSTTASIYGGAYVEYHLNGFLSNKIPVFRKYNWFFIVGSNSLVLEGGNHYVDVFFSIENIFKVARIDFVQSFRSKSFNRSGIKLNIPLVSGKVDP
ncbi:DUF5686 family protein [Filimonas effusa]|uniref:Uncharacterized protein n=1 Tax=Filimonas effusa TaxID=2508721 RepID=A0A4V1MAD0_9BACT|nr:DUF5686 family protein [Filimonas effusa]RXK85446.1 hypothetical protein ESB13_01070 [Filimonas effusa]